MADSALYVGERDGARVFKVGRVGFDAGTGDLGTHVYTGKFKTERIAPAGSGGLVNFRRVVVHLLVSGSYQFDVKVWVDGIRTTLGSGSTQLVTISGTAGELSEITEEIAVSAEGSHIQVELTLDSDNQSGIFLIESIFARGRVIRQSASRSADAS